jgi:hypothetical protein
MIAPAFAPRPAIRQPATANQNQAKVIPKPAPVIRDKPVLIPTADGFRPSGPQQRILDALAWLESVRLPEGKRTQVALLADQSPTSSAYGNNLGALRTAGLIDYPSTGVVRLTDAGRSVARSPDVPPTTDDLHRSLFSRLPGPQVRILQALITAYPGDVDRAELAERADASPTSSAYGNNLGALRTLGLIDYPHTGRVVALPVLFLE